MKGQAKPLHGRSPGKRLFSAIVSLCMIVSLLPTTAFAEAGVQDSIVITGTSRLCEHHTEHTADCGYTEGTAEIPCSHEHDESCGGLTDPEACNHTHDEACGYIPATEGTPCTYVCEICNAQDNGNPATPSDAQPEECTCETLCTEEEINADCPVCSVEGAELDKVCVGAALLLTAPTLRTGEIELYVGGQQIKESGCYENQNGTWKKVDGTEPANGQFSYDADTFTLTLNQAMIVNYQDVTVGGGFTYPGSVIAFSQSADVSLTIVVSQGTSNITGTGGIRVVSKAGDASLSISGPGSLEVNVDKNDSGISLIGSKNVNLNIDGADVKTLAAYYYGVDLHAGDGFKAAAVVNNGKLTAGGSGGIGIYYRWTNPSDSGTSSLTVSGNAVVDTRDSKILIASQASEVQVSAGSDGNGGIVFDGKSGTVYGDVTLQEDLEIGTDETLTIPDGSSLDTNGNLTNSGTIINNGTLTGEVGGSGTVTPKITTDSLPNGTVGESYTATLEATGNNITWSSIGMPDGLTLNSDGTITGTPTTADTYTFTVTATNASGSASKEFTLAITLVSVTDVTLDKAELSLFTGESVTLTATVKPDNATNKNVTWESNNTTVATVDTNGNVAAVAAGEATITVKTADGNHTATCQVKVTQPTYGISADISALDFSIACPGYERPAAKTVTITNTSNQALTLNQPASTNSFEVGTLSKTKLAAGETATFTVQPKSGLAEGAYSETITVSGSENTTVTISATFTVQHQLEKVAAKAPTCTATGNKEYFVCKVCGKYFDTDGKTEITQESTVIPATGHSYGEPEWSWSEDGKTCAVTFTCKNDAAHKETPKVTVTSKVKTPATCTEKGVTTYTASVEFNGQTHTATKDVTDIPATGHSYDNGKCTVCGAIASDFKAVITAGANGSWQKGTKDSLSFTSNAAYKHFRKVQVDGKDLDAANYTVKEGSTIVTLKAEYLETLSVGKHTLAIVSDTGTAAAEFTIQTAPTSTSSTRYYVCQSCGHHDWTATDAGYRCDYCGKVVTEQISGYPNVKGIYTAPTASPAPSTAPGSPATGDESNLVLWVVVLAAGSAALARSFLIQRKKEQ